MGQNQMNDPVMDQAITVLNETMRLLMMGNRSTSIKHMRCIVTEGPDGPLLRSCLTHIEREWPGETQAEGILRDFHALPPAELAALRAKLHQLCDEARRPSGGGLSEVG